MKIIVPMDKNDKLEGKISPIKDLKFWLYFEINDGKMQNAKFYNTKDEIKDFVDIVIVNNEQEDVWPFMEKGIAILVAPTQRYIEDIVEAYIFKELYDLNQ